MVEQLNSKQCQLQFHILNTETLDMIHRIPFLCLSHEQSLGCVETMYKCNIWCSSGITAEMYKV